MIVLDTNVFSELMRVHPDESVRTWASGQERRSLFVTSLTIAEVLQGIDRLPMGRRRRTLEREADLLFVGFDRQVLPFDNDAAFTYADVVDQRVRAGRPIDGIDAQIAAICRSKDMPLATRNTKDFEHTGIDLVDPWGG